MYIPGPPPSNVANLGEYLKTELERVSQNFSVLQPSYVRYQRVEAEPPRSREGDTGFFPADAGTFDPGSSRGLYWFDGAVYRRLNDADGLGGMAITLAPSQLLTTTYQLVNFLELVPLSPLYPPRGMAVDLVANTITVQRTGLWRWDCVVDLDVPFAEVMQLAFFVNGVVRVEITLQNTNQVQWVHGTFFGVGALDAGDVVDVRARVVTGTGTVTANYAALMLTQMLQAPVTSAARASVPG